MNGGVPGGLRGCPAPAAPGPERFVTRRGGVPAGVSRCIIKIDNVQFQPERSSILMTHSRTSAPCRGDLPRSLDERVNPRSRRGAAGAGRSARRQVAPAFTPCSRAPRHRPTVPPPTLVQARNSTRPVPCATSRGFGEDPRHGRPSSPCRRRSRATRPTPCKRGSPHAWRARAQTKAKAGTSAPPRSCRSPSAAERGVGFGASRV